MQLKNTYSAREVASLTGLSRAPAAVVGRPAAVCVGGRSKRTAAGGFTERRYTPVDLLELMVLADLRRQGLSVARIRLLLETLRDTIRDPAVRCDRRRRVDDAADGRQEIYARTAEGEFINLLRAPDQPMLVVGDLPLRELTAKTRASKRSKKGGAPIQDQEPDSSSLRRVTRSEKSCRGRRPGAE